MCQRIRIVTPKPHLQFIVSAVYQRLANNVEGAVRGSQLRRRLSYLEFCDEEGQVEEINVGLPGSNSLHRDSARHCTPVNASSPWSDRDLNASISVDKLGSPTRILADGERKSPN